MKNLVLFIFMAGASLCPANAQLWSNEIDPASSSSTGANPYSEGHNTYNNPLTVEGPGRGSSVFYISSSDSYRSAGWTTSGTINTNDYYRFRLKPAANRYMRFISFSFNYEADDQGPRKYELRYSFDDFATFTSVSSGSLSQSVNGKTLIITFPPSLANISKTIEFRLYGFSSSSTNGSMFGIEDFIFDGAISPTPLPVTFGVIKANFISNVLEVTWETLSEVNNNHFDVEVSVDGNDFEKMATVVSQAADGNSATTLIYKLKIDVKARKQIAAAGFFLLLLFLVKRFRKLASAGVLFMPLLLSGCSKTGRDLQNDDRPLIYVRIKQVDIDSNSDYSRVVRAN